MKILFDHQIFVYQNYGGISRYFVELAKQLALFPQMEIEFSVPLSDNAYLKELPFAHARSLLGGKFPGRMTTYNLVDRAKSRWTLSKGNHTIFHPTYYDDYFLDLKTTSPFVITVHDMIHELYPGLWNNQEDIVAKKKKLIYLASGIIAVSENTKKDLLRIYPSVDPEKMEVIHHGNSFPIQKVNSSSSPTLSYILYVGLREHYKNFDRLLLALKGVFRLYPDVRLLCAGGGGFSEKEVSKMQELGIAHAITYSPITSDAQLALLYQNALFFVYPSLYEGFGIPILEAFSSGCPVAASTSSCFEEVAGKAAAYFNGHSVEEMRALFEQLVTEKDKLHALREMGYQKVMEYTWENTAKKTHQFYQRILAR